MALKKVVSFAGFSPEYHKIIEERELVIPDQTEIIVAVYKDAAARAADINNVVTRKRYRLDGVDYTRDSLYAALKELDEFSGAEDC